MNLSVQNHIINSTRYASIQKTSFKGKFITQKAFDAEPEVIERIKTLPKNVFLECSEFVKFCKSIDITPRISTALTKRLAESHQSKGGADNTINRFIESNKYVVEGYKWLLKNCRKLLKNEIAQLTEISFDTRLPQYIRNNAKELLENNSKIRLG